VSDSTPRLPDPPFVFVTVGTDHHPFDRLVRWADGWTTRTGVACLVQTGTSVSTSHAAGADYLPYTTMTQAMSQAVAVVCHGGPATIMEVRRCGRIPIVVPRDPERGEHVDGHQIRFSQWMADRDQVVTARELEQLDDHLERALADEVAFRVDQDDEETVVAVQRFTRLVNDLMDDSGR
jgi:UDP-N-acetylglucosamine transferase subunit ALG13